MLGAGSGETEEPIRTVIASELLRKAGVRKAVEAAKCSQENELWEAKGVDCAAGGDGDVLFAVDGKCHRRSINCTTHLKVPERFSGNAIQGDEVAFGVAREDESTGGRKHTRPGWREVFKLPFHFADLRIDGPKRSPVGLSLVGRKVSAAVIGMSGLVGLRRSAEDVALLACGYIEEICS